MVGEFAMVWPMGEFWRDGHKLFGMRWANFERAMRGIEGRLAWELHSRGFTMPAKKTTPATLKAVRLHLSYAVAAYFQQQHAMRGNNFATDAELDMLLAEPLEHLDMLPREVVLFVDRMLNA